MKFLSKISITSLVNNKRKQ